MSLAALKRKSETKHFNQVSANTTFALNGTRRNNNYIGKNNFISNKISTSTCSYSNNANSIKTSTKNTKGMISSRFKVSKENDNFTTVQPDSNSYVIGEDTQGLYIENLASKTVNNAKQCTTGTNIQVMCNKKCFENYTITDNKKTAEYDNYEEYMRAKLITPCSSIVTYPPRANPLGRTPKFGCGQPTL